jgi:hypothetical protein
MHISYYMRYILDTDASCEISLYHKMTVAGVDIEDDEP